jgi:predicted dehydrogenase
MTDHAIAIVGAGVIVEHGHLPAYSSQGLPVRSIFDVDQHRAQELAHRYGLDVAASIEELFADPNITIIDFAITPQAQQVLAVDAVRAGKHVLAQKPLAADLANARRMVEETRGSLTLRSVNQQMRWEPNIVEARKLLDAGKLGEPVAFTIHTNMSADFPADHWLAHEQRLMALYGAVHFLDAARFLLGEPTNVTALLECDPGQAALGEMWINAWLEWTNGPTMVIFERYTNWAADLQAEVRLEGTLGTMRGRFGLWDSYPAPSPSIVQFKPHGSSTWTTLSDQRTWLPDAFAGPMLELFAAADGRGAVTVTWEDNLKTLALVEALYESNRSRSTVSVAN